MKKHFFIRKIQLKVDSDDKDYISEVYKKLYSWAGICRKAANLLQSHHYVLHGLKDILYLKEGTKAKLTDNKKDENGILSTSILNSGYRMMIPHFKGAIPTPILSSLNQNVVNHFQKDKMSYLTGERSLRNFRRNLPIPFKGTDLKFKQISEDGKIFHFTLFKIPFKTYLGTDVMDKRVLLNEYVSGMRKIKTSMLKLENNKIFLIATFEYEPAEPEPEACAIAELQLGLDLPIALQIGKQCYSIGNREVFLHRRMALRAATRRRRELLQKAGNKKLHNAHKRALELIGKKEQQYVCSMHHLYSKQIVDICQRHKVGTILLNKFKPTNQDEQAIIKNWSYYELEQKIKYKSERIGICIEHE